MADTMMIRSHKAIAGCPPVGEVGEVDAAFGKMLVEKGHATDVTELVHRLELSPAERYATQHVDELKDELAERGLKISGSKRELVQRLLHDDDAPEDPIDEKETGKPYYD